jgi:hypothetical protein
MSYRVPEHLVPALEKFLADGVEVVGDLRLIPLDLESLVADNAKRTEANLQELVKDIVEDSSITLEERIKILEHLVAHIEAVLAALSAFL